MQILHVLDQAFRTTVEEQDETILWLIQSMQKPASQDPNNEMQLLLTDHAVFYALKANPHPPLQIAELTQTQPADINRDISNLIEQGVQVMVVYEDLWDRGLEDKATVAGVDIVNRHGLHEIYINAEHVWHW